jgi:hypothetical protein
LGKVTRGKWSSFVSEFAAYGDRSFAAEPAALVAEREREALDLAGWGFVLWCPLRAVRDAAEQLGEPTRWAR